MSVKIQLRREAASVWTSQNPILALGEPGFETDTNQFKIGDGTTSWTSLDYMRQDFVSVVASGLNTLSSEQSGIIKEGSLVLTESDGIRWFYKGSGEKSSAANYVPFADISPAWDQVTNRPASLLSIADLTTGSGNYIYATASNVYTTGVITDFGRSLIDDVAASGARSTLGVVIGTDVQAYNATLAAVAAGTYTGTSTITSVGTLSSLTITDTTVSLIGGATTVSTANTTDLTLATNSNVSSANIVVGGGLNGNINVSSVGTGNVILQGNTSGSGANIIVQGGTSSSSNANVIINSLGSGAISLQGGGGSVGHGANVIVEGARAGNYTPANVFINSYHSGVVLIQGGDVRSGVNGGNIIVRGYGSGGSVGAGSVEINGYSAGNVNIKSGSYGNVTIQGGEAAGAGSANITVRGVSGNSASVNINSYGNAGYINLRSNVIVAGSGTAQANIVSSGNFGLLLAANSTSGLGGGANILIEGTSSNPNIRISPSGSAGNILVGCHGNFQTNIFSSGNYGLLLATNLNSQAANILIEGTSTSSNVNIRPYGSGVMLLGNGSTQANIISNGTTAGLLLGANSSVGAGGGANILLNSGSSANISIRPLSGGVTLVGNGAASNQANILANGNNGLLLGANSSVGTGGGANILIEGTSGGAAIRISPVGPGDIRVGNGGNQANIVSSGNFGLLLAAGSNTGANILISPGASGTVNINSLGSGNVHITAGTAGHAILTGGGGANIVIHGGADSPIQINSIGAGNVNIKAGSSGTVKLSGGNAANILIGGTTNADITISPAGTGMVVITGASGLYVQGSITGASGLYVQGSIVSADGQAPKTLYFNPISGTDLGTTANWYLDKARTLPAGFLPTSQDTVIFQNDSINVTQDTTFKSMILLGSSPGTGGSNIAVGTNYKLRSDIYLYDNSLINGDTGAANFSSGIIGNVIFKNTSYLTGSNTHYINGDITFYDSAKPQSNCSIYANNILWTNGASGDASTIYYAKTTTFTNSYAIGHFVGGTVITNGNTEIGNSTFINGNTTLIVNDKAFFVSSATVPFENAYRSGTTTLILNNDPSAVLPTNHSISTTNPLNIIVNAKAAYAGSFLDGINITSSSATTITFNNDTYLGSVGGTFQVNKLIFNNTSYNNAGLTTYGSYGSVIFNDSSYNANNATTHKAIFNDTSYNNYNALNCDYAIFNHDSYNNTSSTIAGSGIATFYNSSQNRGTITQGIFNDFSSNVGGATISGSGIFNDFSTNAGTVGVVALSTADKLFFSSNYR